LRPAPTPTAANTTRKTTAARADPLKTMRSESGRERRRLCNAVMPSMNRLEAASASAISNAAYQGKEGLKMMSRHAITTYCPLEKKAPAGVRIHENKATGHSADTVTPSATKTTSTACAG